MTTNDVADRLARLYEGRSLQGYVRWKVRMDRAYRAVFDVLRDRTSPLVDVGCGIGLFAFYLREQGYTAPIIGLDFDERKIAVARQAATRYRGIDFIAGDARDPLPENHDVVLLDILHYFDRASQQRILANAASAVGAEGVLIIRQAIRDRSWRYRMNQIVDALARVFRWMKAERLVFPSRDEIVSAFDGFDADIRPLWGRTPYNTYLFVMRRRAQAARS